MKILAFDWATKKDFTVYDFEEKRFDRFETNFEAFEKFLKSVKEPKIMLFEFGGGDTFKLMAFRAGHKVFNIPGKALYDYREKRGEEKDDILDAVLLYDLWKESTDRGMSVETEISLSFLPFYPFAEEDADIMEVKVLFRVHEDEKKSMVQEKNKRTALRKTFELVDVSGDVLEKTLSRKNQVIEEKEAILVGLKKELEVKVGKFPIWEEWLSSLKGVGATITAGLIGEIGSKKFESENSLKHYAGMIPRGESKKFNRYLKVTLYQFTEGIIKQRTPEWRELYDNMKVYYAEKHEDWSKGKVDNYAKKFVQTKFLLEFWRRWEGC